MPYIITNELSNRAKRLGITIKSSTDKTKKLDVYDGNKLIARIGQHGAKDYHLHKKEHGEAYAQEKRRLYYQRHPYNVKKKDGVYTADYLAKALLW